MPIVEGDGFRMLSVDPGLNSTGWALWYDRRLVQCGAVAPERGKDTDRSLAISHVLRGMLPYGRLTIEVPRLRGRKEANPQDILRLAKLCGWIEGGLWLSRLPREVEPRGWKGTIPKPKGPSPLKRYVIHKRNCTALVDMDGAAQYEEGLGGVPAMSELDVADAVGLGLWALGNPDG